MISSGSVVVVVVVVVVNKRRMGHIMLHIYPERVVGQVVCMQTGRVPELDGRLG